MTLWIVVETTEDGIVGVHALSTMDLAKARQRACDDAHEDNCTWGSEIHCVEVDDNYEPED